MVSVLFVCTGNICRSPTAEAVFRDRVNAQGLDATYDSAGTFGYHIGSTPDIRAIEMAAEHGIEMSDLRARKITEEDFDKFDLIIALDKGHERTMRRMIDEKYHDKIKLFLDYHDGYNGVDVSDPYYGDKAAFKKAYDMIEQGVDAMIEKVF
ncbi:MAG: low molecular weight protein-tyrosine-phosphatase [Alcanivorax sp.]